MFRPAEGGCDTQPRRRGRIGGRVCYRGATLLITAAAAGGAAVLRPSSTVLASASQPTTPVNFDVPAGPSDCHAHIFGDPRRFPFRSSRAYTPEPASVEEMRMLHRALHTDRVVVVNPSVYGTDNSCTLDAVKQLGSSARAN